MTRDRCGTCHNRYLRERAFHPAAPAPSGNRSTFSGVHGPHGGIEWLPSLPLTAAGAAHSQIRSVDGGARRDPVCASCVRYALTRPMRTRQICGPVSR